ncbi:hypothetical protein MHM93_14565 [Pseudoalteromonas sp. MM17-2]|uniref:hypothetical protein n=1 Tax=Pseudoalteromonas sp. MM17-2 TaxID=2917753 RepID=UPI001EF56B65|nr:hypothetical protein [Pseudoalteromonas sp. MM17-2]MCG7545401.1 hypothetical protein [Pseudoalteromonas sp. MM17-2]
MSTETEIKIYKEAQQLAVTLAEQDGWDAQASSFNSQHKSVRVRSYFAKACEILQHLNGHEMSDIVDEVESHIAEQVENSKQLLSLQQFLNSVTLPNDEWLSPTQAKHLAKELVANGFCLEN